ELHGAAAARADRRAPSARRAQLDHARAGRPRAGGLPAPVRPGDAAEGSPALREPGLDRDAARARRPRAPQAGGQARPQPDADREQQDAVQLLELDSLLHDLARADERKARIVELYYFGGLTRAELAGITGLSPATLGRELSFARSWIAAKLEDPA